MIRGRFGLRAVEGAKRRPAGAERKAKQQRCCKGLNGCWAQCKQSGGVRLRGRKLMADCGRLQPEWGRREMGSGEYDVVV